MTYWLFKTEPAECGIDDLLNAPASICWSGIRNYQARNFLRDQVAIGDQVLIYHSQCKAVGIAGIAEITRAAYADPHQFVVGDRYFDSKATITTPRWFNVDVCFKRKFQQIISLAELKQIPALHNMMLLKQGRLSVQPVSTQEWLTIMDVAGGLDDQ